MKNVLKYYKLQIRKASEKNYILGGVLKLEMKKSSEILGKCNFGASAIW